MYAAICIHLSGNFDHNLYLRCKLPLTQLFLCNNLSNSYKRLFCNKVQPKYDLESNLWFVISMVEKMEKQAGAELGQAQPELGFGENDLSLRGCIRGWG